jgi:hypothetical protein
LPPPVGCLKCLAARKNNPRGNLRFGLIELLVKKSGLARIFLRCDLAWLRPLG